MIIRPCLLQRTTETCLRAKQPIRIPLLRRHFHASSRRNDDNGIPNHYETLDLPTNASPGEVKKQFYKLSKSHHPDLHPNDPNASQRFVKISEAYATLSSPDKRSRYDRDFLRTQQPSSHPSGSFSSASPAGGRPASGLSRRRTQFRGPPPSFYRSGGWGQHGEKRSEHAEKASHTHEAQGRAQSNPGAQAGTGPGGFTSGYDNDVPHFDQRGHYQTHSQIERTRHKARRKHVDHIRMEAAEADRGTSVMLSFFMLGGVLLAVLGVPMAIGTFMNQRGKRQKDEGR
ncbi:hypothetical protein LTR37_021342 [Vermiconidia calcicola]|uniref:Uncharacterized protein n=1 Tax=Vermiconidia calcicola TaxID=1690605 RepID=A0ACC3MAR0_9PEZI|nr:hypothetical protein LTR37_021342 [Vermiconidia calcicola]